MPKQNDLPAIEGEGVAPKKVRAIEVAADEYVEIRDTRMGWTKKEVAARTKLADLMKKHELKSYKFSDHEVVVIPGVDKIKVKAIDGSEEDDGKDEGEE